MSTVGAFEPYLNFEMGFVNGHIHDLSSKIFRNFKLMIYHAMQFVTST